MGLFAERYKSLANIYLFNVNKNTRKRWENYSKLTIRTTERRRSCVFTVNFYTFHTFSSVSIVGFEQVNISWVSISPKRVQHLLC